jgi:hypothetical protein
MSTAERDAQRKVAEGVAELASEVAVDTTVPRAAERGLTSAQASRLVRLRYRNAIEALGRI